MQTIACPAPHTFSDIITMAHGGGGKQTHQLIQQVFYPAFKNEALEMMHDGAFLKQQSQPLVFTTDSYVIQPIFFSGGDIGSLAVTGTVNDLAMCGAKPLFMSCAFIIEEGFKISDLKRIVHSMQREAEMNSVKIVTGDTKVIERVKGENIFINTSGIGKSLVDYPLNPHEIAEGDTILISGDVGRHGMAVMAQREGFEFTTPLMSDCASLLPIVEALIKQGIRLRCLRDLTRGGVATALVELCESSGRDFVIDEEAIPVSPSVNSACEILGIDPLYVANEGRFVAFVPKAFEAQALEILKSFNIEAALIGNVGAKAVSSSVTLKNSFGTERFLYRLAGDQLPRIC